jgi:hypothetical protein
MRPALSLTVLVALASLSAADGRAARVQVEVKRGTLAQTIDRDLSERVAAGFSGATIVEYNGALILKAG